MARPLASRLEPGRTAGVGLPLTLAHSGVLHENDFIMVSKSKIDRMFSP